MDIMAFVESLETSGFAEWFRGEIYAPPIVNAVHIIAVTLVFGTIAIVDLRLLGIPSNTRPVSKLAGDLLKWTWIAFALAVVSGIIMFIGNAKIFYVNTLFRIKMVLLLLAGLNMLIFEMVTVRSISRWDQGRPVPFAAKAAGAISLTLWISILFVGRWVGYTKEAPQEEFDFDALGGFL